MSDYNQSGYNYHSKIIGDQDEKYLVQGEVQDQLMMVRNLEDLLEPEKQQVQKMPYFTDQLEEIE